jgi:transcriptional regulator with XRE-family HTH domain
MSSASINTRIGRQVRRLRDAQGLSLEALSQRCGVSRSNISLIERGESSATATVLEKLSGGLGVTLATLFEPPPVASEAPSPLVRVADQALWTDPATGYCRRSVSPGAVSPIQLVDVVFPAGQRVVYERSERSAAFHQQVWMIEGRMDIAVDNERWTLDAGDCLAMQLDATIQFHNPGGAAARYLVALVSLPMPSAAGQAR